MNPTLWVLVAIKIFVIFWLIYYIFERRKRKGSENNLVVIEQGTSTYAGAPVTQLPKVGNEYNQQQLYAASANIMPPNIQPSSGVADPQSNVMPIKS